MTAEVIALPRRQPEDHNNSGEARCLACGHQWAATAPIGSVWMRCPSCGLHKAQFRATLMPAVGGAVWTCPCGCEALFATPDALRCCLCGAVQRPFD